MAQKKITISGIALGAVVSVLIGIILFYAMLFLGAKTGVIGICSTAPAWWNNLFMILLPTVPIVAGLWGGIWSAMKYSR